jgi:hypothetical protein
MAHTLTARRSWVLDKYSKSLLWQPMAEPLLIVTDLHIAQHLFLSVVAPFLAVPFPAVPFLAAPFLAGTILDDVGCVPDALFHK